MISAMVKDPEIMGLCGETKIANKRDSWVTAIQVFEYFVSHHLAKSFESVFGGVTCLPGCFCMYRIKAPKGGHNYWVPILANPDIVEHYSENVVETLHEKNSNAPNVPQAKAGLYSTGSMQNNRPRRVHGSPFSKTSMDQLNYSQPDGTGSGP
jgi:hypothetical protein